MRYYGTLTGRRLNETKQKVYQEGEAPEYWDAYFAEILNVKDETGKSYGNLLIKATQKTALRLENFIVPNSTISFDCKSIEEGVIVGIRNWCTQYVITGGTSKCPPRIRSVQDIITMFGDKGIFCTYCTYRNNKKLCEKYKIN